ncbi:hypothetical protein SEA_TRUCKEE_79 [Arthrobacter phage Truckee]|nr:hypothetical protein SEA_TRUCKEE_79 [Arthrobacter phage Truckee]
MSIVHVVFGTESHRSNYARRMAVNPRLVIRGTQPTKLIPMMTEDVKEIKIVLVSEEMWKPVTDACAKSIKEMMDMIKGYRRLGVTVTEVKYK